MNEVTLSPEQRQVLRAEGYQEYEIDEALGEISRNSSLREQYNSMKSSSSVGSSKTTAFQYNPNDNLVKWQLELNDILDRTEHILRGDIVIVDGRGGTDWKPNEKPEQNPLNDYGVAEFMRVLSMYLTRNTILGNYTREEIDDILYDFGRELNNLYFMKYEKIGMDTPEKRQNYPMFFFMMKHTVESAYSRAIGGAERGSLREARSLQQQEQIMPNGQNININAGQRPQARSIFNPMRYFGGKYK